MLDPTAQQMKKLLEEYKIMVFYKKMTLTEYEIRRAAFEDLRSRMGERPVRPTGWVTLRKTLRAKDPDLEIPVELRELVYHGKA